MRVLIPETIPECPDHYKLDSGEWDATAATIEQRNGRYVDEVPGYRLKRHFQGYGWVHREVPKATWERLVFTGRIRNMDEPLSEDDAEGEAMISIQRMRRR